MAGMDAAGYVPPPTVRRRSRAGSWIALCIGLGVLLVTAGYVGLSLFKPASPASRGFSCPAGEQPHTDPKGFALCAPDSWETSTGTLGTDFMALAPDDGSGFRANVNVVAASAGNATLDETAAQQEEQLSGVLADYATVERRQGTVGGQPSSTLVYTFSQGTLVLRGEQTVVLNGGRGHFITYTARDGAEADSAAAAGRILDSFTFL